MPLGMWWVRSYSWCERCASAARSATPSASPPGVAAVTSSVKNASAPSMRCASSQNASRATSSVSSMRSATAVSRSFITVSSYVRKTNVCLANEYKPLVPLMQEV